MRIFKAKEKTKLKFWTKNVTLTKKSPELLWDQIIKI